MRITTERKMGLATVNIIHYDDIWGVSELFLPVIEIDFWSEGRVFWLKTLTGTKLKVTRDDLRKMNLKMVRQDVGVPGKSLYKMFMIVNSPRKALEKIPILSISDKLNKVWRGRINVEREYEKRWENGYRGWSPTS